MKVSIIIPIYNTGQYLAPCIESICAQTYEDLQIIMVDDGSECETADLCDKLAAKDARIEVFHKKNEGVSIARNLGLSKAKGDVICFVDSDDTIDLHTIERFVEEMRQTGAQIVMCDATTITPGKPDAPDTITSLAKSCILHKSEITPAMLAQLAGSAWRCAYRRTDMLDAQARFPIGIKFSEDRIFNLIAMGLADKIAYIKEPLYNRLIREGSACFRYYPDMTEQIAKMRPVMIKTVEKYWGKEYVEAYERQIAGHIRYAVTNYTAPASKTTFKRRANLLKGLCANAQIVDCLTASGDKDLRSRLILNGNYILLTVIGTMTNQYHKLCKKGQYQ